MNTTYKLLLIFIIIIQSTGICQKRVSITIDDVPNTYNYKKDNLKAILLNKLDSIKIPVTIFINEGLIYKTDSVTKNFELLNNWTKREYITLGNHTFNHSRYSTKKIDSFSKEVINGEAITKQLAKIYNKNLTYFRFPYNDLGKDSIQHFQIKSFLKEQNYIIAPFTIESSDWMYNTVYEYYLDKKDFKKAQEIGNDYLVKTLEYFDFFEEIAKKDYNRDINQIYLCHDNRLNADFLPKLINALSKKNYNFISLKEALNDTVYQQKDYYFKKWGISWLYRWKRNQAERIKLMKQEPKTEKIYTLYKKIMQEKENLNKK